MPSSTLNRGNITCHDHNNNDEKYENRNNVINSSDSLMAPLIKDSTSSSSSSSSSTSFLSIQKEYESADFSNVIQNKGNQRNEVVFTDVPKTESSSINEAPVKTFSFSMKSSFLKKK